MNHVPSPLGSNRRYVSLNVAADYLGVSVKTIRRMIAAGEITGHRVRGKIIRVDLQEIDNVMRPIPSAVSA